MTSCLTLATLGLRPGFGGEQDFTVLETPDPAPFNHGSAHTTSFLKQRGGGYRRVFSLADMSVLLVKGWVCSHLVPRYLSDRVSVRVPSGGPKRLRDISLQL